MSVEFVPPKISRPYRVLLLGAATQGWYGATDEERREKALPRFKQVTEHWQRLGARPLATLDDDLFMVGEPSGPDFTWYLMFELDELDTLAAMIQAVRESVDGVRLDAYVRFQARVGRPFFLIEG